MSNLGEKSRKYDAQCPRCGEWSRVEAVNYIAYWGFWWEDSGPCPKCGEHILVETECEFRERINCE